MINRAILLFPGLAMTPVAVLCPRLCDDSIDCDVLGPLINPMDVLYPSFSVAV